MICPRCKRQSLRIRESTEGYSKPCACCIGCLSVFVINLEYIEGTEHYELTDTAKIEYAHKIAAPKPPKDRPDFFRFEE